MSVVRDWNQRNRCCGSRESIAQVVGHLLQDFGLEFVVVIDDIVMCRPSSPFEARMSNEEEVKVHGMCNVIINHGPCFYYRHQLDKRRANEKTDHCQVDHPDSEYLGKAVYDDLSCEHSPRNVK